jgi:hypothetical protein
MSTLAKPFTESDGAPTAAPVSDSLLAPATDGAPAPAAPAAASTPTLTRRSMVAGMAAGLMPAPTAAAAAPGRDPDARLLELGEQYRDLCAQEPAANDACEQCCGSVPEVNRPQALRHRLEDHVFGLDLPFDPANVKGGFSAKPELNPFYTDQEVRWLRHAPLLEDPAARAEQRVRIEEIERAWKAWLDARWAADEAAGVHAAGEAIDQVIATKRALAKEIAAVPAKTLAGVRVRAQIVADVVDDTGEDDCTDDLMIAAIVRDILAMSN